MKTFVKVLSGSLDELFINPLFFVIIVMLCLDSIVVVAHTAFTDGGWMAWSVLVFIAVLMLWGIGMALKTYLWRAFNIEHPIEEN